MQSQTIMWHLSCHFGDPALWVLWLSPSCCFLIFCLLPSLKCLMLPRSLSLVTYSLNIPPKLSIQNPQLQTPRIVAFQICLQLPTFLTCSPSHQLPAMVRNGSIPSTSSSMSQEGTTCALKESLSLFLPQPRDTFLALHSPLCR